MITNHVKITNSGNVAEITGLNILTFLASDEKRFERFVNLSGIGLQEIRDNAQSPAFLGSLFDYLLTDETLLQIFCANENIAPSTIRPLRQKLPGAPVEY